MFLVVLLVAQAGSYLQSSGDTFDRAYGKCLGTLMVRDIWKLSSHHHQWTGCWFLIVFLVLSIEANSILGVTITFSNGLATCKLHSNDAPQSEILSAESITLQISL